MRNFCCVFYSGYVIITLCICIHRLYMASAMRRRKGNNMEEKKANPYGIELDGRMDEAVWETAETHKVIFVTTFTASFKNMASLKRDTKY